MQQILALPFADFNASYRKYDPEDWAFVSIRDVSRERCVYPTLPDAASVHVTYFDDVSFERGVQQAITPGQAVALVDFIERNRERNFLIHCTAGVHRSGAVAKFTHVYLGRLKDNYDITDSMFRQWNPQIKPNMFVYNRLMRAMESRSHEDR